MPRLALYTTEANDNCAGTIIGTTTDPLNYTTPGTYTVTWTYSDGNGNQVSQPQTVIVQPLTTTVLTYNGPTSSPPGATVTLSATLQAGPGKKAQPVTGQLIHFNLNNTVTTALTDATGSAKVTLTTPTTPGTYVVSASYTGACPYAPSSNSKSFTVKKK